VQRRWNEGELPNPSHEAKSHSSTARRVRSANQPVKNPVSRNGTDAIVPGTDSLCGIGGAGTRRLAIAAYTKGCTDERERQERVVLDQRSVRCR